MKTTNSIGLMMKWNVKPALVSKEGTEVEQSQLLHFMQNLTKDRQNLGTWYKYLRARRNFIQLVSNVLCHGQATVLHGIATSELINLAFSSSRSILDLKLLYGAEMEMEMQLQKHFPLQGILRDRETYQHNIFILLPSVPSKNPNRTSSRSINAS